MDIQRLRDIGLPVETNVCCVATSAEEAEASAPPAKHCGSDKKLPPSAPAASGNPVAGPGGAATSSKKAAPAAGPVAAPAAAPAPLPPAAGQGLQPTERLYLSYDGNFQLSCSAHLLTYSTRSVDGSSDLEVEMAFDRSVFHPQGGGQPSDVGKITNMSNGAEVAVESVSFDFGTKVMTHRGKLRGAFSSQPSEAFRVNDECSLVVDEETRFRFSELHTAGHMVDSAMLRCGYDLPPLKGYHFAEGPYVEYRGKVEPNKRDPLVEQLKEAFAALAEEDIVTTISMMPVAEAQARLSRTAGNIDLSEFTDPEIRIVSIAGFESACGGTHVRSTKQLRDYTVTGIKVKKDVVRIKYDRK